MSLRPRFRTVSIIPGIDTAAPERTETSRGSFGSPKTLPACFSMRVMPFTTSPHKPSGKSFPTSL
eukprot:3523551-Rhodomonas_salina.1